MDVAVKNALPGVISTVHADIKPGNRGILMLQFSRQLLNKLPGFRYFSGGKIQGINNMSEGNDEEVPSSNRIAVFNNVETSASLPNHQGLRVAKNAAWLFVRGGHFGCIPQA